MLNEELKTKKMGKIVDESMMTPINKQQAREKLERETREFLRKGKVNELPPSLERAESLRF